jgi:hypothetical protein
VSDAAVADDERDPVSYELAVWRRATGGPTAPPADVYAAICDDQPHPAIARFNVAAFEADVRETFGDANPDDDDQADNAVLREADDFTGAPANWMTFTLAYSQIERVVPRLIEIAVAHQLAVYDPQQDALLAG